MISEDQYTTLNATVGKVADSMEAVLEKPIRQELKGLSIHEWMSGIKGIGPRISASVIALVDPIEGFDTISKLWAYAGSDVVNGVGTNKNSMNGRKYNWELKCLVCEKIPAQFIKQGKFYRELYDRVKTGYKERHPEAIESGALTKAGKPRMKYTPIHIERMTRRKVGKIFIAHVWLKWREAEGLPCRGPWVLEHGGHTTMIDPPESPE